jgi:hypothetical protein
LDKRRKTVNAVLLLLLIFSSIVIINYVSYNLNGWNSPFFNDLIDGKAHIEINTARNRISIVRDYYVSGLKEMLIGINLAYTILFFACLVIFVSSLLYLAREAIYLRKGKIKI